MAAEPSGSESHETPESGSSDIKARRPWTTPQVTPARIEATTNKLFSPIEFSPSSGPGS